MDMYLLRICDPGLAHLMSTYLNMCLELQQDVQYPNTNIKPSTNAACIPVTENKRLQQICFYIHSCEWGVCVRATLYVRMLANFNLSELNSGLPLIKIKSPETFETLR